ncbi:MAG: NAD(P)-dependent alcohol dehydrogenase [Pseudomonadota bacterium]|nr:NAD(P)-dependent alcohol dehydrogenase [Pseudomonadota bacterium]
MKHVEAYGTKAADKDLEQMTIKRRTLLPSDVQIRITYCGVCHTDIHFARNELGMTEYPCVPGHEIIGRVIGLGRDVKRFRLNQLVGVGCMVDSCNECSSCDDDLEQFCENGMTLTYSSPDPILGGMTMGGYSQEIVVDERFVLRLEENLDNPGAAPLLCAGITMYSPLRQYGIGRGDKIGIIGLGGLGHMGIKLADAMGAEVHAITSSESKFQDAIDLGAKGVLITSDAQAIESEIGTYDLLINTIPADHDFSQYLGLLKRDKTMVIVGASHMKMFSMNLLFGRKKVAGSLIGGIKETQEMLDFCAKNNIFSDIEVVQIKDINKVFDRVVSNQVRYRAVIDMSKLT